MRNLEPGFSDSGYASAQNDERWVSAGRAPAGFGLPGWQRALLVGWAAPLTGVNSGVLLPGWERSRPTCEAIAAPFVAAPAVSLRERAIVAAFVRSEALGPSAWHRTSLF